MKPRYAKPVVRDLGRRFPQAQGQAFPPLPGGPGDPWQGGDSILTCSSGQEATGCTPLGNTNATNFCEAGGGVYTGAGKCRPTGSSFFGTECDPGSLANSGCDVGQSAMNCTSGTYASPLTWPPP